MNVKEAVADRIANASQEIADAIIEHLAKETIDKRVNIAVQAFAELDKLNKEIRKIKPDVITYGAGGDMHQAYSKTAHENLKKNMERVEKITKALEKALDKNDWGDLPGILGKGTSDDA